MGITKNLKPLKPSGNETREELLERLEKYTKWFEETKDRIEKDAQEAIQAHKARANWAEEKLRTHSCSTEIAKLNKALSDLNDRLNQIARLSNDYY